MSDIYFKNYKKRDDTGEIPITQSEKDFQDRLNQQKYEEIIKNQERLGTFESYQNGEIPPRQDSGKGSDRKNKNEKKKKKKGCGCGCGTLFTHCPDSRRQLRLCLFNVRKNKLCSKQ